MHPCFKFLTPLAIAGVCGTAQAAVTLYTNEASYLAAVGATTHFLDFAGSPATIVSGASFSPAVDFASCTDSTNPFSCGPGVLHNSDGITDVGGSQANNGVASVAWRFNLPDVFAFGFNYVSGQIDGIALVDNALTIALINTTAASGFIGLVSDTAFFAAIGVNAVFPGQVGNDRYFVDDFRINQPGQVPEPGALTLVALALAAAHFAGRGRKPLSQAPAGN